MRRSLLGLLHRPSRSLQRQSQREVRSGLLKPCATVSTAASRVRSASATSNAPKEVDDLLDRRLPVGCACESGRDALPPSSIFVSDTEANRELSQLDHHQAI